MDAYLPSSLPAIEAVDVVILAGLTPNRDDEYMKVAAKAPVFNVIGGRALRIASMWRQLPAGEEMRCHVPPFGLRFRAADAVVCQASICWDCNNIFGDAEGRPFHLQFDAQHTISQDLFTELQRTTNYDARGLAAALGRLSHDLQPIFALELQLGNQIASVDDSAGPTGPPAVIFRDPLHTHENSRRLTLLESVTYFENRDRRYPLHAGYKSTMAADVVAGPLPEGRA